MSNGILKISFHFLIHYLVLTSVFQFDWSTASRGRAVLCCLEGLLPFIFLFSKPRGSQTRYQLVSYSRDFMPSAKEEKQVCFRESIKYSPQAGRKGKSPQPRT